MKKVALLCLFMAPLICARADQEEIIDHSVNLTATYEFTSGSKMVFDLDQCSRLCAMLLIPTAVHNGLSNCVKLCLVIAHIIMAKKEFERGEIARGLEQLQILTPFSNWYVLLSKSQKNDRLYLNRLGKSLTPFLIGVPIFLINEPYSFFRDLNDEKYPVYFE